MTDLKDDLTELQTFGLIESLGGFIWAANHNAADGKIEWTDELEKAVTDSKTVIVTLARSLTEFGVDNPVDDDDVPTKTYKEWYSKTKELWYQLDVADRAILLKDTQGGDREL